MSIITRTGDNGETSLMYNRRVSKCHPRIEACGCADELMSFLGLARALSSDGWVKEIIISVQRDLILLMGELATATEDLPRYVMDGHQPISRDMVDRLESVAREVESKLEPIRGWAIPGETVSSATIDIARAVCRRVERRICSLHEAGHLKNPEIVRYLNRLSDLLWLLARWEEQRSRTKG